MIGVAQCVNELNFKYLLGQTGKRAGVGWQRFAHNATLGRILDLRQQLFVSIAIALDTMLNQNLA